MIMYLGAQVNVFVLRVSIHDYRRDVLISPPTHQVLTNRNFINTHEEIYIERYQRIAE